jgi:plastocyanin
MKTNARLPLGLAVLGLAVPAAAALALPAAAALADPPAAHTAAAHVVKLKNIQISPSRLTVRAGDRVTWQFLDAPLMSEHTVTSRSGGLRFPGTGPKLSGSYSVTFRKRGTYLYECTIHPGMQGRIVVR